MPPRRGRNLPGADKTFLDDPELVLIRPLPTANAIGRGENFDLRAVNEIGHKARLIIGSKPTSDGPRRSLTLLQHRLGLRRQRREPLAHVGGARRQPDPRVRRNRDHAVTPRISRAKASGS